MTEVTFKGDPVRVEGHLPAVGSVAPAFKLVDKDLNAVSLDSLGKKRKLLNIFVSLDTPVCSSSIHAFERKASSIPDLILLNISMDLPFAGSRFCKVEELDNVITLSAFRSDFPHDYGVAIAEGPLRSLCARAVIILDKDNKVLFQELVSEITHEPNYDAALAILE